MTLLEAAVAVEAGKLIRRKAWNKGLYLFKSNGEFVYYDNNTGRYKKYKNDGSAFIDALYDDWEIYGEDNANDDITETNEKIQELSEKIAFMQGEKCGYQMAMMNCERLMREKEESIEQLKKEIQALKGE